MRSPVDRFDKVWMSWRLPPLQRRKNIFVPMVSLKLPRVAIECLKLSQMFVALIVAMTRHSMVGQQSHASTCVRVSTNFDQEFSIDRFWGGLLPVDPMDYVTRATLRLEQLDPGRRRFHETYTSSGLH